jgi:hypothetical protein
MQEAPMPKIVISYRREDTASVAGRIYDRLCDRYGRDAIFRDIDAIPLGADFREHLEQMLNDADVLICIIGGRWLGRSRRGPSRISEPGDYIRLEVERALQRNIPIIPVLIDKTKIPTGADLPESVHGLLFRQAITINQLQDFDVHTKRLIDGLDRILASAVPVSNVQPAVDSVRDVQAVDPIVAVSIKDQIEGNKAFNITNSKSGPQQEAPTGSHERTWSLMSKVLFSFSILSTLGYVYLGLVAVVTLISESSVDQWEFSILVLAVGTAGVLQPIATRIFHHRDWAPVIPLTVGICSLVAGGLYLIQLRLLLGGIFGLLAMLLLALAVSLRADTMRRVERPRVP